MTWLCHLRFPGQRALGPFLLSIVSCLFLVSGCRPEPEVELGETYEVAARPEIWQVLPRSQAERVGLLPYDLLLSYNEEPVYSNDDVRLAQGRALTKESVTIAVLRGDDEIEFSVQPGPLGAMPVAAKYPSSLALALEDIMNYLGLVADYDRLSALTGESFTFSAREDECRAWWPGGKSGVYLEDVADLAGLTIRPVLGSEDEEQGVGDGELEIGTSAIAAELRANRVVLVQGGWPGHRVDFWGIAVRYSQEDSTVYGYSLDAAAELPLTGSVAGAYVVEALGSWADPADLLANVLRQALELSQAHSGLEIGAEPSDGTRAERDSGIATSEGDVDRSESPKWKSGIEAYDLLVKSLYEIPFCPTCGAEGSQACFDRLIWASIANKESANRFLEEMKQACPEYSDGIMDIVDANRVIISRLEGIVRSGAQLGEIEDQRKLARVIIDIELVENDLIGLYEELLAGL